MESLQVLSPVVRWWPFVVSGALAFICMIWYRGLRLSAMGWPLPIGAGTAVMAGIVELIGSGGLVGATFYDVVDAAVRGTIIALIYGLLGALVGASLGNAVNKFRAKSPPA
jgi:hypothetical protein